MDATLAIALPKCLNGHDVPQYEYICVKCGSHVETDIQRNVRLAKEREKEHECNT